MPRVLADFNVRGAIEGFTTIALSLCLAMLDDGSMLGAAEPAGWLVETGKAAIDYCESTAVTSVYSCRFVLVQWGHEQVARVE